MWVRRSDDVEMLRVALEQWRNLYNTRWLIEHHGHRSPGQLRQGLADRYRPGGGLIYPQRRVQEIAGGTLKARARRSRTLGRRSLLRKGSGHSFSPL